VHRASMIACQRSIPSLSFAWICAISTTEFRMIMPVSAKTPSIATNRRLVREQQRQRDADESQWCGEHDDRELLHALQLDHQDEQHQMNINRDHRQIRLPNGNSAPLRKSPAFLRREPMV